MSLSILKPRRIKYRKEEKAALDTHKSHIVGISFSIAEGDAAYLPLARTVGENAADQEAIWNWLTGFFADPTVTKIAHNLAFESQFLKYLFDTLKLPKMKMTAKEQDALDDEAIILLKEWCAANREELVPLFNFVQEYRHYGKMKGTYIEGYLKHINSATGRLHPDLLPLATETGRGRGI